MVTRGGPLHAGDLGSNQWRIETGFDSLNSGENAQLVSPALSKKGNSGPNDEGVYRLPFKITFTVP